MDNISLWLSLCGVPNIGNSIIKRLIIRFKTPEKVINSPVFELMKIKGISCKTAEKIQKSRIISDNIKRELDLAEKHGYKIITLLARDYPGLLREIHDPPPYLYISGSLAYTDKNIAVVGSRNAGDYGISVAKQFAYDLACSNFTVVSGMAAGVDTAAHTGAISAGKRTIAVLGSGLLKIYPAVNHDLFYKISENGAVVSEFSLNTLPKPYNFPKRNRIIAGMSLGTVVVCASEKSGALITARLAQEENREVFAVPGSVNSLRSRGSHALIKQGAKLAEDAQDILEELGMYCEKSALACSSGKKHGNLYDKLSLDERELLKAMDVYPVHLDEIVKKVEMPVHKLSGLLLKLEIKGLVKQSFGKLFSLSEDVKIG